MFKINPLFLISRIDNCFNVFSKSKAFQGIIFQGKLKPIPSVNPPVSYLQICILLIFALFRKCPMALKAVDTIGNCQRLAFAVGVSQHMHKIISL